MTLDADIEREALRVFGRYTQEIVEGLGFCPWAKPARLKGQVRESVELSPLPRPERAVSWVRELGANPSVQIGFLIHPRCTMSRDEFEAHVLAVSQAYTAAMGAIGATMAIVGFHPDAKVNLSTPYSLVNFIRRSPDPTLQAVRLSTLATLRERDGSDAIYLAPGMDVESLPPMSDEPLHARVATANFETVKRVGVREVEAMLEAISEDRRSTYAKLNGLAGAPRQ